ncbi:MAG TPA: GIY-YIG nuclease family protein, partial [Candidatus Angelobacter sp.]|nr:GIY-YIG nuclease family protein [Candidatus Angelobacter sp.]
EGSIPSALTNPEMFYVYVLQSESTGRSYTGSTADLDRRFSQHNSDSATATKNRGPWILVHSESFPTRREAMAREKYFKTGHASNYHALLV